MRLRALGPAPARWRSRESTRTTPPPFPVVNSRPSGPLPAQHPPTKISERRIHPFGWRDSSIDSITLGLMWGWDLGPETVEGQDDVGFRYGVDAFQTQPCHEPSGGRDRHNRAKPAPDHTEGLYLRVEPFPGLGASGGGQVASCRTGHRRRVPGPQRRSWLVLQFARNGSQGGQLLPSKCRLSVAHRLRKRQDDHGRSEEARSRTRTSRAPAGTRTTGDGPQGHCRNRSQAEGLPVWSHGIPQGRSHPGLGGHCHRLGDERRHVATSRGGQSALGRSGIQA